MVSGKGLFVLSLTGFRVLHAIQKQSDDLTTDINESSAHTSEVLHHFIDDDLSLILFLLVLTLLAVLVLTCCPTLASVPQSSHTSSSESCDIDHPLMHEEMETTAQSLLRRLNSAVSRRV